MILILFIPSPSETEQAEALTVDEALEAGRIEAYSSLKAILEQRTALEALKMLPSGQVYFTTRVTGLRQSLRNPLGQEVDRESLSTGLQVPVRE